jgi:hypothetical protein
MQAGLCLLEVDAERERVTKHDNMTAPTPLLSEGAEIVAVTEALTVDPIRNVLQRCVCWTAADGPAKVRVWLRPNRDARR